MCELWISGVLPKRVIDLRTETRTVVAHFVHMNPVIAATPHRCSYVTGTELSKLVVVAVRYS